MEEFVAAYENVLMSEDACAQTRGQCQQECQQAEQNYQQNDDQENEAEEDEDDDANVYDEETCWSSCMANYGMSSCESLSDKVNCRQMDYYNKDEDPYYVGATCKNGGVYLETFTDMYCTRPAAEGTYEALVSLLM